jgi:hypothetical protein
MNLLRLGKIAAAVNFIVYSYDAGVLGRVQCTRPFHDTIRVKRWVYRLIIGHCGLITGPGSLTAFKIRQNP